MRLRKTLRYAMMDCPVCLTSAEFHVYESWDKPTSKRSRVREDLRTSAKCTRCGYRLINLEG